MTESLHATIADDVRAWADRGLETFLFLVLKRVDTPVGTLYLTRSVVRLDEHEAMRKPMRTHPTEAFARHFYGALRAVGAFSDSTCVAALHSHPFSTGTAAFSSIDHGSFADDQRLFHSTFGVEFVGLVVDRDVSAFDGVVVDTHEFIPVTEVLVVGRSLTRLRPPRGVVV